MRAGWKRAVVVLIVIEAVIGAGVLVLNAVEKSRATVYSGARIGSYAGFDTPEGRSITNHTITRNTLIDFYSLLTSLSLSNLRPGIYDVTTVYSASSPSPREIGRSEVKFSGDDRIFYASPFCTGERRRTHDKVYVTGDFTNRILYYRGLYYGKDNLTIHEVRISRRFDATNLLIILMGAVLLIWGAVFISLPRDPVPVNWKTVSSFLLTMGLCLIYYSSVAVALVAAASMIYFAGMLIEKKGAPLFKPRQWQEEMLLFLLFAVIAVGSAFAKYDKGLAFGASFLLLIYAVLFTAVKYHDSLPGEIKIAEALAYAMATTALFSLIHFFVWTRPFAVSIGNWQTVVYPDVAGNIASLFENWPTRGADKMAMVLTLIFGVLLTYWKKLNAWQKTVSISALFFGVWSLSLTHSREAYIFIAIAAAVFLLLKMRKRAWIALLPILVVLALSMVLSANQKIRTTFTEPSQEINIQRRLFQDKVALEIFRTDNKLTGIGVMNFTEDFKRYEDSPLYEPTDFIHNIYLAFLAETGLIGLGVYLAFFVLLTVRLWKTRGAFMPDYGLALVAGMSVASLATSMYIYAVPVGFIMWILLGYSRNAAVIEGEKI